MPQEPNRLDGPIRWRVHIPVPPERVHEALSTDIGRATFWADTRTDRDGRIVFRFPNGVVYRGRELQNRPAERYVVEYFGGVASFEMTPDGKGGTDLLMTHTGQQGEEWVETCAGWLNVLFPLKAVLAYGVDLRNHDPERTWDHGFIDG